MKRSRWVAISIAFLLLGVVTAVSALTYEVQWGDTLGRIAAQFNVTVNEIVQVNNIANPDLIFAGQSLEIPTDTDPPTPTPVPPDNPTPIPGSYTVRSGDTLSAIARRFNTTVAAIAQLNGITNINFIQVGQLLRIPGGSVPPVSPTPPPPADDAFALGGQSVNFTNAERMKDAGMTWIKIQYKWEPGDSPDILADEIQAAQDNDLKVLLSITGEKAYPVAGDINFSEYIAFVRGVAALHPNAIEIWNEMNIDFEWPAGEINPTSYVNNMLAPAYNAIKAEDANILVISGALAPTGFDDNHHAWADDRYIAGLRAAGAANYLDCIGVHHNAGATAPSATSGHPGGPHYSWYYGAMINLYDGAFGGIRPLCITELGYLSGEGLGEVPPAFAWAADNTLDEHAQWLGEAVQLAKNDGRVQMLIVYNVDFIKYEEGDPQAGYAIIRSDGSCPACNTIQQAMTP
ncbi:MAG: LysM peptidoglycan-binding domain-containing protein [Chloroflexi bacterium]|nr:LysM peptidoglycan-binding domain-containing protein [Chloroflexota bacterium]